MASCGSRRVMECVILLPHHRGLPGRKGQRHGAQLFVPVELRAVPKLVKAGL